MIVVLTAMASVQCGRDLFHSVRSLRYEDPKKNDVLLVFVDRTRKWMVLCWEIGQETQKAYFASMYV